MEALRNALATLVAAEARVTELVNPIEQIADAVKAVVKEGAIVLEEIHERVEHLEVATPGTASPALAELTGKFDGLLTRLSSIDSSVSSLSSRLSSAEGTLSTLSSTVSSLGSSVSSLTSRVGSMGTDIGTLFARTQPMALAPVEPKTLTVNGTTDTAPAAGTVATSIGELQASIDTAIDATQANAVDELHQNVSGAPAEGSGT